MGRTGQNRRGDHHIPMLSFVCKCGCMVEVGYIVDFYYSGS